MNEMLLKALLARIKAQEMTVGQVPLPLQENMSEMLEGETVE